MNLQYVKPTHISLKNHPQFDEKWLQERIADDPMILGLGELELKDVERRHPKAGRLDLLLRDPESGKRYEVELMLGTVDESHIIRTIEYWDIEKRRYPQYDHCAVIVAENITSRFLNVIGLFNSAIPLIALQLSALQVGDNIVLNFAKVLDELVLGEDDDDDEAEPTNRDYWEQRGSAISLAIMDECFEMLREIQPNIQPKYNKFYVGITLNGRANNFVTFKPKKQFLRIEAKISDQDEWKKRIDDTGFVLLQGHSSNRVTFTTTADELKDHRALIKELLSTCCDEQSH